MKAPTRENLKLLYQGSVKNLYARADSSHTFFEFSDRYSLFDWGEMPDHLIGKGEALSKMGALFFELLSRKKIAHHFISLTTDGMLEVQSLPVVRPKKTEHGYNYSFYQSRPTEGLIPLEVIFRFGIGQGSSLIERAKKNPALLKQWCLNEIHAGQRFEQPLIDFSTKLEPGDRYLTHGEACILSGMNSNEWHRLLKMTTEVAFVVKEALEAMKLELWDGKIEFAFTLGKESNNRGFMVVDSIGLDELRVEKNGVSLSKEFLREFYRQTPWYQSVLAAKRAGLELKKICSVPPSLPPEIKNKAEALYRDFTAELETHVKQGSAP